MWELFTALPYVKSSCLPHSTLLPGDNWCFLPYVIRQMSWVLSRLQSVFDLSPPLLPLPCGDLHIFFWTNGCICLLLRGWGQCWHCTQDQFVSCISLLRAMCHYTLSSQMRESQLAITTWKCQHIKIHFLPQTRTRQGQFVSCKFHNTGNCLAWAKVHFSLASSSAWFQKMCGTKKLDTGNNLCPWGVLSSWYS